MKKPEIGDKVFEYCYGVGVTFIAHVKEVQETKIITTELIPNGKPSFIERLFGVSEPPKGEEIDLNISDLEWDENEQGWTSNLFL